MHFEHIIVINDPANPGAGHITREQLWRGLLWRAEDARPFMPGLERCDIVAREGEVLERRLSFGEMVIRDRVTLIDGEAVIFDAEAMADHGGGRLQIRIEESGAGHLMLRFTYDTCYALGHENEDAGFGGYLRQAYEDADNETVRVLRQCLQGAAARGSLH